MQSYTEKALIVNVNSMGCDVPIRWKRFCSFPQQHLNMLCRYEMLNCDATYARVVDLNSV